jgi:hypothetical protein
MQDLGGLQGIAGFRPLEQQFHGGLAVHFQEQAVVAGAARDVRHLAQLDAAAGLGDHRQVAVVARVLAQVDAAHLPLHLALAHLAGGQVPVGLADARRHLVQGQAQALQFPARHGDGDLLVGQSREVHLVDAPAEQFRLVLARQLTQFGQAAAGEQHPGDGLVADDAGDFGRLRVLGQVAELVHRLLHLVHGGDGIGAFLELDADGADALAGGGGDVLDAGDGLELLFQGRGDALLHVLGGGAAPLHPHRDEVQVEVGEELDVEPGHGEEPGQHQDQHEQVGRHRVVDEGAQEVGAFHGRSEGGRVKGEGWGNRSPRGCSA